MIHIRIREWKNTQNERSVIPPAAARRDQDPGGQSLSSESNWVVSNHSLF